MKYLPPSSPGVARRKGLMRAGFALFLISLFLLRSLFICSYHMVFTSRRVAWIMRIQFAWGARAGRGFNNSWTQIILQVHTRPQSDTCAPFLSIAFLSFAPPALHCRTLPFLTIYLLSFPSLPLPFSFIYHVNTTIYIYIYIHVYIHMHLYSSAICLHTCNASTNNENVIIYHL